MQRLRDIEVFAAGDLGLRFDDHNLAAHSPIELRHLEGDHTAADDDQTLRQCVVIEPVPGIDKVGVCDSVDRWDGRARAGVEDHLIAQDRVRADGDSKSFALAAGDLCVTGNPFRIVADCEAAFDSRAERGGDIACAPDHFREVDFHRRNAKAEIGSPAS